MIQADQVPDWNVWDAFLGKIENKVFESQEATYFARRTGHLIGVLEDRFGWDFVYSIRGGFIIEDRNGGMPVYYKTTIPIARFREAAKKLPKECVSLEPLSDMWQKRWDSFRKED